MLHPSDTILIVEDRADWRDILQTALLGQGFTVHSAASYQDALDIMATHEFGLAVIDPVLDKANRFNRDGISVIQKLRESHPNVPVVILTG
jgi:DNA-binding response OmpR family regulator